MVSTGGGDSPQWSHDGKEIFYTVGGANGTLYSAEVKRNGGSLEIGAVHAMFGPVLYDLWAVSPDGRRILTAKPVENAVSSLTVIQNWTEGLKK